MISLMSYDIYPSYILGIIPHVWEYPQLSNTFQCKYLTTSFGVVRMRRSNFFKNILLLFQIHVQNGK